MREKSRWLERSSKTIRAVKRGTGEAGLWIDVEGK